MHAALPSGSSASGSTALFSYEFDGFAARFVEGSRRHALLEVSPTFTKRQSDAAFGTLLHLILRREGRLDLHSAAVSPDHIEGAIVIAGPSGVGKTSLTLALAHAGWTFLTDDYVVVWDVTGSPHAGALRTPLYLTQDSLARVPPGRPPGKIMRSMGKAMFRPEELFPGQQRTHAPVRALVFPQRAEGPSKTQRLRPVDTFQRLLELCPFLVADPTAKPCLSVARALADLPAYALHAGPDLLDPSSAAKTMEAIVG